MLYIIFGLLLSTLPDTVKTNLPVKEQASQYIENVNSGENIELNTWALKELTLVNCKSFKIVKDLLLKYDSRLKESFTNSTCEGETFTLEEKDNFEASIRPYIWSKSNVDLHNNLISGNTPFTKENVSFQNHFIHLQILMRNDFSRYYTSDYLQSALEAWTEEAQNNSIENDIERDILISNIIWGAYILDRYDIIEEYYRDFLNAKLIPYSFHKLRILGAIEYTFYTLGYYDRSLKTQYENTLPLAYFINDSTLTDEILQRQGVFLFSIGKFEESKEIYEYLFNKKDKAFQQSALFNNLGINYLKLGQANKYITFQLQALDQAVKDNNYKHLLNIYRNLFIFYTSVKDLNNALSYIERAKEVANANNDTTELALIDSYLATFYWSTHKDHKKALKYLSSAEKILTPEKNYTTYINLLIEKGSILTKINSLDEANDIFEEVRKLSLSKSDTPNYVDALVNLTEIKLKQDNLSQASEYLKEIKLYSLDNLDFPLLTKYYTVKATYNYKTDNKRAAIAELKPVVDQVIDRAKNNTDSQEGYWSVEDEYLEAFALMIELFIETNASEEALILLDQLKTINDASLYNSPLIKASKLSEKDLVEEKRLNDRLQNLRKRYLNATQEERFAIKTEIDRTSAMRDQILAEVNLNKERELSPVWSVQRSIQPNELVLHFTEVGTQLYVTYLTRDDIQIEAYDFPQEKQEKFSNIADELASGNTNLNHLHELYQFLDLNQIPNDIRKVSVIPDNYLYRIPLEVLPTKAPDSPISFGSSHYLIEDYSFRYFTSLKEFDNNQRTFNTSTQNDFSAFGISDFGDFTNVNLPSLPFATVETNNINSVLSSFHQKEVYNGSEATKDAFKRQVGSSRLVHVATHSEVSEQNPLFSTIYLKSSNPGDTLESEQALYAYELFDTPLNSEFIMLNSCSSGSGNYIQGSGVMGISRALRYAGAKSLALNLWSVNDKVASEFATDFYSYLNEGATKSEAIRKAKLNQLKRSNANPHFWGAYMMIGNPSPVTGSSENTFLLFSLLAASILFTGYITYQKAAA